MTDIEKAELPLTDPFIAAVTEAEKLIAAADFIRDPHDLAEGYDYLQGSIAAVLQLSRAHGTSHPYFVSSTGPYTKMGLDNPDTLYYHATIEPGAEYLLTGVRGSTVDLSFQVLKGDYTATDVPNGDDAFDDRRLEINADGSYQLPSGRPRRTRGRTTSCSARARRCWPCARCTATGMPSARAAFASSGWTPSARRRSRPGPSSCASATGRPGGCC
ncbi:hypothetical protein GCM10010198_48010 [Nocardia seriolae]|nr:conserved hypothetical protein [Nocardia seriolae]BEK86921.1 hypothetical protein NSERKGN1266_28720 [Nocardia seriolae]GEM22579.1 hypothetical protein NS2_08180 [Nocardia seriolae NBRC 15557]